MGTNILLLGAPGAGKGTQSKRLAEEFDAEHVTTGDALRANKGMDISDMDTEYDTPGKYMDAGDLVPDTVVNAIVEEALTTATYSTAIRGTSSRPSSSRRSPTSTPWSTSRSIPTCSFRD